MLSLRALSLPRVTIPPHGIPKVHTSSSSDENYLSERPSEEDVPLQRALEEKEGTLSSRLADRKERVVNYFARIPCSINKSLIPRMRAYTRPHNKNPSLQARVVRPNYRFFRARSPASRMLYV